MGTQATSNVLLSGAMSVAMACDSQGGNSTAPPPSSAATRIPSAMVPKPTTSSRPKRDTDGSLWSFEDTQPGKLPTGFSSVSGVWQVQRADRARSGSLLLVQSAENASPVFNILLIRGTRQRDVDLSVGVRAHEGEIDQGGGLVWRATNAQNYYIARYNPLEDNFRVYTVKDGKRRQLASADVEVDARTWHTLRVTMVADHIECFLDDKKHLDVRDGTFPEAGLIGLWTKADAKTHFDDLSTRRKR